MLHTKFACCFLLIWFFSGKMRSTSARRFRRMKKEIGKDWAVDQWSKRKDQSEEFWLADFSSFPLKNCWKGWQINESEQIVAIEECVQMCLDYWLRLRSSSGTDAEEDAKAEGEQDDDKTCEKEQVSIAISLDWWLNICSWFLCRSQDSSRLINLKYKTNQMTFWSFIEC